MGIHSHLNNTYTVDGFPGKFSVTVDRAWNRIHHCELNENGIGCASRTYLGSVPRGIYGDDQFEATPNTRARDQVEAKILDWVAQNA